MFVKQFRNITSIAAPNGVVHVDSPDGRESFIITDVEVDSLGDIVIDVVRIDRTQVSQG